MLPVDNNHSKIQNILHGYLEIILLNQNIIDQLKFYSIVNVLPVPVAPNKTDLFFPL